jgi:predicted small integral membrane protein
LPVLSLVAGLVSVLIALGVYLTDSRLALLLATAFRQRLPLLSFEWAGVVRALPSSLVAALVAWIIYQLWRLAQGGPGANVLLLAFATSVTAAAASVALVLVLYVLAPSNPPDGTLGALLLAWIFLPGILSLAASLLLALGLLRSRLIATWIAWSGAVAAAFAGLATALVMPATWNAFLPGPSPSLGPIQALAAATASDAWARILGSVLYALFWIALGLALYTRASDTPESEVWRA